MKKKKLHTLDIYIIFCFVMCIIYTVIHIIVFINYQIEMNVIAALVYGLFGGEVLLCALLKKLKLTHIHQKEMKDIELIDLEKEDDEHDGVVG